MLKRYATTFGADLAGWKFLTGSPDSIRAVEHRYGVFASQTPGREVDHTNGDVRPLLDAILVEVPEPGGDATAPLQLLVASLDYDNYLGRLAIGRIVRGWS